jgi:putative FmdB family regulatory protein
MPIYEYRCAVCGQTFEKIRRMEDADKRVPCPHCESEEAERQVSGFAMAGCGNPGSRFT